MRFIGLEFQVHIDAGRFFDSLPRGCTHRKIIRCVFTCVVAEALVDIFSRLGVPEEILSDLGTQFVLIA